MARESIADLVAKLHNGRVDRREFFTRAVAAGLSVGLARQALMAAGVSAQELPEAARIGNPDVAHTTDTSKGVIKLYSSWPLTGTYDRIGGDAVEAVKLALADFGNAAGGFAIEYEALDDGVAANNGGWEAGKESENANKVVNDADAMVYMATYNSGAAKISIPILNQIPMAQISYANTYPGLTKLIEGATEEGEPDKYYPSGKRNYMRVCPADDIQGAAAADWATAEGKKAAYVIHDQSLYGKGVASVFKIKFEQNGGTILGFEGYDPKATDYQALMASIADKAPDIMMCGATVDNNAGKIVQDMRSIMGEEVAFLGPDGLNNNAFVEGGAEAAEGAYLTFAGYTPDKLVELGGPGADYVTRMTAQLGYEAPADLDAYACYGYETAVVVLQAIERAGEKDRAKILDAMMSTEGFVSLLGGTWAFTETGDTDSAIIGLSQVIDGKITYLKTISGGSGA